MTRKTWQPHWHGEGGGRELLRLAVPFILSNSFIMLQITLDRMMLSWSDSEAVGASMIGAVLFWTPISLLQYTANYATTFVAQYLGAGQTRRVGPSVWQALYFSLVAGLAFLALIPLVGPLIALAGHSARLQELEAVYLRCLCFSALPTLVTAAAGSFFAGRGDSRTVMLLDAVGMMVNGVLAYAWIFGNWGFPRLGIAGAGWATVAGTSVSAVLAVTLMMRSRYEEEFATRSGWKFDPELFLRLMRFGGPNGFYAAMDALVFTVFMVLVGWWGSSELTATSITFTLNLIAYLPIMGIGQAVAVLVGQRLGEDRPEVAARTTWAGFWIALSGMGLVALAYVLGPELLLRAFRDEADPAKWDQVRSLAVVLLRFVAVYTLFDSMNLVFSFALRGAGDTRFVSGAVLALAWPLMVLPTWSAYHFGWGLFWAWSFAALYIIVLALTYFLRFLHGKWRSMRVIEMVAIQRVVAQEEHGRQALASPVHPG